MRDIKSDLELLNSFKNGDIETFKQILPKVNFSKEEIINMLTLMFDPKKYTEQKAIMDYLNDKKKS